MPENSVIVAVHSLDEMNDSKRGIAVLLGDNAVRVSPLGNISDSRVVFSLREGNIVDRYLPLLNVPLLVARIGFVCLCVHFASGRGCKVAQFGKFLLHLAARTGDRFKVRSVRIHNQLIEGNAGINAEPMQYADNQRVIVLARGFVGTQFCVYAGCNLLHVHGLSS